MSKPFSRLFNLGSKNELAEEKVEVAKEFHLENQAIGTEEKEPYEKIESISLDDIIPNPYQPREIFEDEKIRELAQSIQTHGLIQPIVLRKSKEKQGCYEIVSGERRYRALCTLGRLHADCIVRHYDNKKSASVALIENIQRENLNPLEEARAFQDLIELFGLTQEALAQRLGKGQSTVANKMRLLQLPDFVQTALLKKEISERHGRALLILKDNSDKTQEVLNKIIEEKLNVKQTEAYIEKVLLNTSTKKKKVKHVGKNIRLAINEFNRVFKTMEQFGYTYKKEEEETEEYYEIRVRIPKEK